MNVPHFKQQLDYSCLPACVRMVLAYYGDQRPEPELRRLLKTRVTGTSPANVMLRLPDIGYEAVVVEASRSLLRRRIAAGEPCIAHVWTSPLPHWDEGVVHAVVVADVSEGMGGNWSHADLHPEAGHRFVVTQSAGLRPNNPADCFTNHSTTALAAPSPLESRGLR
jgi:ABC-type bacteriocin/lantibiotic exporter with double-glycine peptidase domain